MFSNEYFALPQEQRYLHPRTRSATSRILGSALRHTAPHEEPPAAWPEQESKKPLRFNPIPHRNTFTVDKAGFELIVPGTAGIRHGTTGWWNGTRCIYANRWGIKGWYLNDDYALLKRFQAKIAGIEPFKGFKRPLRTDEENDRIAARHIETHGTVRYSWQYRPMWMSV